MKGIYKITSPSGKIYIGQSVDVYKRIDRYKRLECKSQVKLYNSLKNHGFEAHLFEVMIECDIKELNKYERHYQELYNVLGKNGLNCRLTKYSDKSGLLSEETKEKMRKPKSEEAKSKMRKPKTEDHKLKTSESRKGKKHTKESILKIKDWHFNNPHPMLKGHSDISKEKMSYTRKGKPSNNRQSIFCVINNEKLVFSSITEASVYFSVLITSISKNINNVSKIVKTSKGKIKFFRYE